MIDQGIATHVLTIGWDAADSRPDGLPDALLYDNVEVLRLGQRVDDRVW